MKNYTSPLAFRICAVAAVIGLAACDLPERPADYRVAHAIGVQPETRMLSLTSRPESEVLSPEDQFAFDSFVRDYHLRASGPVGIQVPGNAANGTERIARIKKTKDLLAKAGIDRRQITELPSTGGSGGTLIVSFATSKVSVPDCGDWSRPSSANWANRRSQNYGCATQRNLGLMIANPADLKKASEMEEFDGSKASGIISTLRGGGPKAAAAAPAKAAP